MSREVFVLRDGKLVPKHLALPVGHSDRAPAVHPDGMGALWHPATGKYTDSKSEFRRMTRESGCYEVGNDIKAPEPRTPIRLSKQERVTAIRQAIEQLSQRSE